MKKKTIFWIVAIVILLFILKKKGDRAKECEKHFTRGGWGGGGCPDYCMGNIETPDIEAFDMSYPCQPSKLFNIF